MQTCRIVPAVPIPYQAKPHFDWIFSSSSSLHSCQPRLVCLTCPDLQLFFSLVVQASVSYRHHPDLLARGKTPVRLENRKTNKDFFYHDKVVSPAIHMTATPLVAPQSNPVSCWDKLPGEIRNRVYQLVAGDFAMLDLYGNRVRNMTAIRDRQAYLKLFPGLAYMNRTTYNEFSTFLLENKILKIHTLEDLRYLEYALDHLPREKGWNSVKNMHFSRFSDLATSSARARELFDFMMRCHNIEELTLQVKLDLLHIPDGSSALRQLAFLNGTPGIKSPQQVAETYELNLLFDLPHLRKLTMICKWHSGCPIPCTPLTMITFWDLQDWVAQGYAAYASNVKKITKCLLINDPREQGAWTVRLERGRVESV